MTAHFENSVLARLDPAHTALIVIDMQNDFCAEGGYVEKVVGRSAAACRAIVESVNHLIDAARQARVPVCFVRAIYDPAKLPPGMLAKQREKSDAICCHEGSWGAAFHGVAPDPEDLVVTKHSYSAFHATDLAETLRNHGVKTAVFAGVQTNVCVESSVRDALCHGFYTVVVRDCVASHAPQLHDATLMNVQLFLGDLLDLGQIRQIWTS